MPFQHNCIVKIMLCSETHANGLDDDALIEVTAEAISTPQNSNKSPSSSIFSNLSATVVSNIITANGHDVYNITVSDFKAGERRSLKTKR